MKIYIGGDHAGFELKEKVKAWLERQGHKVIDFGPFEYEKEDDYPDFTIPLAEKVSVDKKSRGIVIAGSGIGEVIASNKVKGIRSVLFYGKADKFFLETSRKHDGTNILCFGSRFVSFEEAKKAIKIWLATDFSREKRHIRRLGKIEKYERKRKEIKNRVNRF